MIDIIEAGKFYLECLKKVHESILKDDILPENTVINVKAQLVQRQGKLDKEVVGAFTLNGQDHLFEVSIGPRDEPKDVLHNVAVCISNIIAKSITKTVLLDLRMK